MADYTSHDTVGASTLATPLHMPSSPPRPHSYHPPESPASAKSPATDHLPPHSDDDDEEAACLEGGPSLGSSRASSPVRAPNPLDERLAHYTVDFQDLDEEPLGDLKLPHEEDRLSDVGGPEDFTANMEKYFMDGDDTFDHGKMEKFNDPEEGAMDEEELELELQPEQERNEEEEGELPLPHDHKEPEQQHSRLHQPAVEEEAELSEFGPPVDMSTPSHLLRRVSPAKDITHLENIEEDPADELDTAFTPSIRKQRPASNADTGDSTENLRQQIADLQEAVQERDQQLERNHHKVLEAASAGEKIKHLEEELEKKTSRLDELDAKHSDELSLREQIDVLQRQNAEKDAMLQRPSASGPDFSALQNQISDMQRDLQTRSSTNDLDKERLETIAYMRQQLTLAQEQLKKRDATLDETIAKLREVTTAKEQLLHDKNAEIYGLHTRHADDLREIERLEAELERTTQAYRIIEDRISTLETMNRPLEEKNSTLEADLTRAQSQVTAQENALKAMAADLPVETTGNTYTEILELIKDLGQPDGSSLLGDGPPKDKGPEGSEIEQLRNEMARLRAELGESLSSQETLESQLTRSQDQLTESHTLINSVESENTRLAKRTEDLKSQLDQMQHQLTQIKEEHSSVLDTIERLQEERKAQQLSPPPSPPQPSQQQTSLDETHQAQLRSLQMAHENAISNLRASHADSTRKLHDLLSASEARESRLQTKLSNSQLSFKHVSAQASELKSLRGEIKRLEAVIAVKDETALAVDQRIARSVEKREKEWERRVDLLLKEREKMGRALMWSWGEKEVGDLKDTTDEHGRPRQGYRYKYAKDAKGQKPVET